MNTLLSTIAVLAVALGGGDREEGLKRYREGDYAGAQAAFTRALERAPDSAELQWNLALAAWRAGDLATAETAAEKYAASSDGAATDRHRGMLGAIRFAEAEAFERRADAAANAPQTAAPGADEEPADPVPLLEQAVQKAFQAKNHFIRAVRAKPTPELVRNTERAVQKLEALKERLEELLNQRPQQPDENGEPGKEGDQQEGDQDPQEQGGEQQDPSGSEQQEQGEQGQGEGNQSEQNQRPGGEGEQPEPSAGGGAPERPEPEPGAEPPAEAPESGEPQAEGSEPEQAPDVSQESSADESPQGRMDAPEPEPGAPRQDAPGEGRAGRELSPEQAQRLLERLKQLEKEMKTAQARARRGRKPVERDW